MLCSNCKNEINEDWKFCNHCGIKLLNEENAGNLCDSEIKIKCPFCRKEVNSSSDKCEYCHESLSIINVIKKKIITPTGLFLAVFFILMIFRSIDLLSNQTEITTSDIIGFLAWIGIIGNYYYNEPVYKIKGEKSPTTAFLLAVLFGIVGAHKFYLNKKKEGLLFILFSWTLIPWIIAIIQGISYLRGYEKFNEKIKVVNADFNKPKIEEIKEKKDIKSVNKYFEKEPEKYSIRSLVIIGIIILIIIITIVSIVKNLNENYQESIKNNESKMATQSKLNDLPMSEKYESENLNKADLAWHASKTYGWDCNEVTDVDESNGEYYYITCSSGLKLRVYPRENLHPRITNKYGTYEDIESKTIDQENKSLQAQEQIQKKKKPEANTQIKSTENLQKTPMNSIKEKPVLDNKPILVKNGIIADSEEIQEVSQVAKSIEKIKPKIIKRKQNSSLVSPYLKYIQQTIYNNFTRTITGRHYTFAQYKLVLDKQGKVLHKQIINESPYDEFNTSARRAIDYSEPFQPIVNTYSKNTVEFTVIFKQNDLDLTVQVE